MLVLTRKSGEAIVVDGPCVIHVVELQSGQVRLGIAADPDVIILRAELIDADHDRGIADLFERLRPSED